MCFAQSAEAVEYTDCTSEKGWDPSPNECPRYDTKQSDGKVPVMLDLLGMQSTPSLPLLPGPLRPGTAAPDRALSMGEIEQNCTLTLNWINSIRTDWLNWIAWNRNFLTIKLPVEQQYIFIFHSSLEKYGWSRQSFTPVSKSSESHICKVLTEIMFLSYLPTPPLGQDMTQGQFLSGVWFQSFPSPRLLASPRLKNLVCHTIYP